MTQLSTIVFDLDGTLVDSAPVFATILNMMLAERGSIRRVGLAEVRAFASHGGPALVGGMLAQDCGDLAAEVADFRARYAALPTPVETLYNGVATGVQALRNAGFALAICSNKPQHLCEKVIADLGMTESFAAIVGSAPDRMSKPAPDLMELVLGKLGVGVGECLYVGDSEVDAALAKAMGMRFAFMTYGYAAAQFHTGALDRYDHFADLVAMIAGERSAAVPTAA